MNTSGENFPIDRTPQKPPLIKPVDISARPRWSVMIPVYNGGSFLQACIESVLNQALEENEMQIEVVDDCSTDMDVCALVAQLGKGRIAYYRQPYNVGSLRNFETCINLAKGKYIHLMHSDDVVHEGFYQALDHLFYRFPEAGAAFCRYQYIDDMGHVILHPEAEAQEEGILKNWLIRLAERQRIQYVAIAVKREVYEKLGAFYGVHYGEDWEMWARIASQYPVAYTPKTLASYRRHEHSISGQSFKTAQNLRDLEVVMDKINRLLPEQEKKNALLKAKKFYAYYALRTAKLLWTKHRSRMGALAQIKQGWRMHKDIHLAFKIIIMVGRMILNR